MQTIYGDNINGNSYKQQNTIQLLNYNKTDYDFLDEMTTFDALWITTIV